MNIIYHNGTFTRQENPILNIQDRALRGHGVFDTMLMIITDQNKTKLCHAAAHFDRLIKHAGIIGIKTGIPTAHELEENAKTLIHENIPTPGHYALNTLITGGPGARGLMPPETLSPQIIMRFSPLPEDFPPINAMIAKTVRRNEGSPLSNIKSINYGDNILALNEARSTGANEAIMLNNAGNIACTTTGNIFVFKENTLYTPPLSDGAMNGIARKILIERHKAQEKSIHPDELNTADGLFLSNSIRGLAPIEKLNGQTCPQARIEFDKTFHVE